MKKPVFVIILLSAVLILGLTSCAPIFDDTFKPEPDHLYVEVRNDTETEIYEMGVSIESASIGAENADGEPFVNGTSLIFDFSPEETENINEGESLAFTFHADGKECSAVLEKVSFGKAHGFALTENGGALRLDYEGVIE